jgi:hypothetical protein
LARSISAGSRGRSQRRRVAVRRDYRALGTAAHLVDRRGIDDQEEIGAQRLGRLVAAPGQALERRLTLDRDIDAVSVVIGDSRKDVQIVKDIVHTEAARRGGAP